MTTPQQNSAIRFAGVVKNYLAHGETVAAVKRTDLEIAQGEFFSLLGPSGCGKTTTMRIIAGFEDPTAGKVFLDGHDVTGVSPNKRDINMVFQSYALFPHLNVFQNVAFGLERRKIAKEEIRRRVGEMLDIVSLAGMERRSPREMSGGQQQRVALARALVNRPRALLLDEPLGALDLKLRQQMQVELKRIQREVGITFVYVTHDQGEALTMSDRIAVMNAGVIEQLGTPRQIYERPSTRFVAGFLGVSNLIPATLEGADGDYAVGRTDGGVAVRLPRSLTNGHRRIELGVRPEKIRLHEPGEEIGTAMNRLTGVIRDASYMGVSTQYIVEAQGGAELTVYEQNVERASRSELWAAGESVILGWLPEHTFVVQDGPSDAAPATAST
jgi:spermidine/putrescine transport system ATP-binding protein